MPHDVVGHRDRPVAKGSVLTSTAQVGQAPFDEVGGVLVVAAGDRVAYGFAEQAVLGEPSACHGVHLGDPVGMPGRQTSTQRVGEEVVAAVPPALVIERGGEHDVW